MNSSHQRQSGEPGDPEAVPDRSRQRADRFRLERRARHPVDGPAANHDPGRDLGRGGADIGEVAADHRTRKQANPAPGGLDAAADPARDIDILAGNGQVRGDIARDDDTAAAHHRRPADPSGRQQLDRTACGEQVVADDGLDLDLAAGHADIVADLADRDDETAATHAPPARAYPRTRWTSRQASGSAITAIASLSASP